jgi:hypothetical protein
VERARSSNRTIVFGLGHHSVAEHAVFNFDILGCSRLAIEALDPVRRIVMERLASVEGSLPDLRTAGRFAAMVMRSVVQQAEASPGGTVHLSDAGAPPPLQWVYPLLLAGLFLAAARVGG